MSYKAWISALTLTQSLVLVGRVHAEEIKSPVSKVCEQALLKKSSKATYKGITVVLDTNVIMNDPYALLRFPGAHIVLSGTVLEELDKHKGDPKVGYAVREFSRQLRKYLQAHKVNGSVADIPLKSGAKLSIDINNHNDLLAKTNLDPSINDNQIVATALAYKEKEGPEKVVMVSNDTQVYVKAKALGIQSTEFNPSRSILTAEEEQQEAEQNGQLRQVEVTEKQMAGFLENGEILWPEPKGLSPNQFVQLHSAKTVGHDGTVARYVYARPKLVFRGSANRNQDPEYTLEVAIKKPETIHVYVNGDEIKSSSDNAAGTGGWYFDGKSNSIMFVGETFTPAAGARVEVRAQIEEHRLEHLKTFEELGLKGLQARSLEQTMALNVLMDDSIDLVFLEGRAGTSKTFSAVAAASKMLEGERKKVLLTRAPVYLGNHDPGALPGGIEEKFGKWNEAILDSLDAIASSQDENSGSEGGSKKKVRHERDLPPNWYIEPFNFIRGRTFSRITLIVDEAQNMSEHEIKTVLTRIGDGAKFIVMGDVRQVDPPFMNSANNGLAVAIDKLTRGARMTPERQSYVAVVKLRKGVRSMVSEIVSDVFEDAAPEQPE